MTRAKSVSSLERRIGHRFSDRTLIELALTHVSVAKGDKRTKSYQRLEFLGDHVLGLVISDMLFRTFPRADEGELSQRLSDLVRKETCAEVALAIDIGPYLRLSSNEAKSGGR
jgi:ribonuclease-3